MDNNLLNLLKEIKYSTLKKCTKQYKIKKNLNFDTLYKTSKYYFTKNGNIISVFYFNTNIKYSLILCLHRTRITYFSHVAKENEDCKVLYDKTYYSDEDEYFQMSTIDDIEIPLEEAKNIGEIYNKLCKIII